MYDGVFEKAGPFQSCWNNVVETWSIFNGCWNNVVETWSLFQCWHHCRCWWIWWTNCSRNATWQGSARRPAQPSSSMPSQGWKTSFWRTSCQNVCFLRVTHGKTLESISASATVSSTPWGMEARKGSDWAHDPKVSSASRPLWTRSTPSTAAENVQNGWCWQYGHSQRSSWQVAERSSSEILDCATGGLVEAVCFLVKIVC